MYLLCVLQVTEEDTPEGDECLHAVLYLHHCIQCKVQDLSSLHKYCVKCGAYNGKLNNNCSDLSKLVDFFHHPIKHQVKFNIFIQIMSFQKTNRKWNSNVVTSLSVFGKELNKETKKSWNTFYSKNETCSINFKYHEIKN